VPIGAKYGQRTLKFRIGFAVSPAPTKEFPQNAGHRIRLAFLGGGCRPPPIYFGPGKQQITHHQNTRQTNFLGGSESVNVGLPIDQTDSGIPQNSLESVRFSLGCPPGGPKSNLVLLQTTTVLQLVLPKRTQLQLPKPLPKPFLYIFTTDFFSFLCYHHLLPGCQSLGSNICFGSGLG